MLQDSLDLHAIDPTVAACRSQEGETVPPAILALEAIYREEMALRLSAVARFTELETRLSEGGHGWGSHIDVGGRTGIGVSSDVLARFHERVTVYAQKTLSIEGAPFTKTLTDYTANLHHTTGRWLYREGQDSEGLARLLDAYSPIRAWEAICKLHDPEAQRTAACRKAAHTIRGYFGMNRGDDAAMRTVKGRVEVSISAYTTPTREGRKLPYGTRLPELGAALHQSMVDSGSGTQFGERFIGLCKEITEYNGRPFESRERVDLGDGVDVVLGFNAFKLYLPMGIAGLINMFLAEFPAEE